MSIEMSRPLPAAAPAHPQTPAALARRDPPPAPPKQTRLDRLLSRIVASQSLWLVPILMLQTILCLRLNNGLQEDEALSINAGHEMIAHLLHGTPAPAFGHYFGGVPALYAVPAAVLDFLGGPALVRGANTVLVLLATVLVYLAARRMFGQGSALVAAVVFAINPVTIFAARFASVDALCFLTLATAFYLAIRSSERNVFAVLAGSLLALAVAEKFVVVLFVPGALGIALALNARQFGVRRAAGSIALMVGSTIATLVAVAALARDDWHGFTTTALGGRILTEAAGTPLWRAGWDYVGLVAVAGVAAVIAMKGHRRFSLLIVAAGLGPVLVEIGFHESASMQRNVGLSMIFLAPVIGVLGTRLVSRGRLLGVRAPVALASGILLLSTGMATSANMFHNWPTSTSIISALRYYAHDGTDRYLVDGSELAAYHLSDTTDYTQWASTLDDRYITPGGTERLREDLQSANFKLVLYRDDGATPALDRSMVATLRTRYTLVARVPVSPNDTHAYWSLWLAELPR